MRAHQQQQETESLVCPEREVMGASEAGGMEHEQLYGNQAAQAALCEEPIDIAVVNQGGWLEYVGGAMTPDEAQVDVEQGVAEMVAEVLAKAGGRPIRRLGILAHGAGGEMRVGEDRDYIGHIMKDSVMSELATLAPHFAEDGFVVVEACNYADGKRGREALLLLHSLLGVPVSGGVSAQSPFIPGLEGTTLTAETGEDGETRLREEEGLLGDFIWGDEHAVQPLLDMVTESGAQTYDTLIAGAGELWAELGDISAPEVGDMTEWLFGD